MKWKYKIGLERKEHEKARNETYNGLIQDATYCESAIDLVNKTSLSDDDGTFAWALTYTKNYLEYLLNHKELIGTREYNETLEKISNAFCEAIYRNDKSYIKKYYNVADQYGGEKSKIKQQ